MRVLEPVPLIAKIGGIVFICHEAERPVAPGETVPLIVGQTVAMLTEPFLVSGIDELDALRDGY